MINDSRLAAHQNESDDLIHQELQRNSDLFEDDLLIMNPQSFIISPTMKYGNDEELKLTVKNVKNVVSDASKAHFGLTSADLALYQKRT